jgi:signal transduction histidine kinase
MQQVAGGQLGTRAAMTTHDEVGSLARSFNGMSDELQERDDILQSVRFAAEKFLASGEWETVITEVLPRLGQAAQVSRIYLFANQVSPGPTVRCRCWHEWVAPGEPADDSRARTEGFLWEAEGMRDFAPLLQRGESVAMHARSLSAAQQPYADARLKSFFAVPVQVQELWWGVLRFDRCDAEREWGAAERHSFRAISGMLGAAIARQQAQQALLEAKATLEQRVRERTRELEDQVTEKERARAELAETQQRLMDISRQAGMAEVATGVLHNVGNVLNSVNVSASLIAERARQSRAANLLNIVELLEQHRPQLEDFLTRDPKGQRVLAYLRKLALVFQEENRGMLEEAESLTKNIEHIKEIVAVQQNYARISGVVEQFNLASLVEDAVEITQTGLQRYHVNLHLNFEPAPDLLSDKHKVLQVLLNLLRNAKQAVVASGNPERNIYVSIRALAGARVRVQVRDNGVGIRLDDLSRIFSHGFTTKRDGHGFGLHLGALTAQQLGGSLTAESQGVGRGAAFTLELPLRQEPPAPAPAPHPTV